MVSKIIALVLGFILVILLFLAYKVDAAIAPWAAPFFVGLVLLYMFSPQVEWWWARRYPPKPKPAEIKFLNKYFTFFQNLNGPEKDKFLLRLTYFNMAHEYTAKVGDRVPSPLKTIIGAEAVRMTFGMDDDTYLMTSHERIVIYPHPFPTPRHKRLHHAEVHHEDGVLIFASEPIVRQFYGETIFNIALYSWISAFRHARPDIVFPRFAADDWPLLAQKFFTPKAWVEASIGLPDPDPDIVAATVYLQQPDLFRQVFPGRAAQLKEIFKQ